MSTTGAIPCKTVFVFVSVPDLALVHTDLEGVTLFKRLIDEV